MARPGLKPPPRHAVVVRGGDAPISEAIPVARSSFPPPPHEVPPPPSLDEKATLRAIPAAARVPRFSSVVFEESPPSSRCSAPPARGAALESAPPPSDAPLAQSIPPEHDAVPTRRKPSAWAILAAAAAGLTLGLTSVLATFHREPAPFAAVQAAPVVAPPEVQTAPVALAPPPVLAPAPSAPAPVTSASAAAPAREAADAAPKPPAPAPKKTIF
jgi:hypothetical protein